MSQAYGLRDMGYRHEAERYDQPKVRASNYDVINTSNVAGNIRLRPIEKNKLVGGVPCTDAHSED